MYLGLNVIYLFNYVFLHVILECNYLGLDVVYFIADLRMYNRFYVIV